MADVIGLVASVIQVASSGLKLSRTLHDYGSAVQGYEKRLKGLDKDIYFTSGIISELGTLLSDARVQSLVSERSIELAREIVAEFEGMFQTIQDIIAGTPADSMGKWKIYFRESKIKLLLSNLDRLKGNLQLLIGVITHASQISTDHPDDPAMVSHRIKILELMVEKEEYTIKYLEEKKKYDNLMVHIKSNSTLGSVSTVHTDNGAKAIWKSSSICQESPDEPASTSSEPSGNEPKGEGLVMAMPHQATLPAINESEGLDNEAERRMDNIGRLKSELEQLKESGGHSRNPEGVHRRRRFTSARLADLDDLLDEIHSNDIETGGTADLQESLSREPLPVLRSDQKKGLPLRERAEHEPAGPRNRDLASRVGKKAIKGAGSAIKGALAFIFSPIIKALARRIAGRPLLCERDRPMFDDRYRSAGYNLGPPVFRDAGYFPMRHRRIEGRSTRPPVYYDGDYSPTHHWETEVFDPDEFGELAEVDLIRQLTKVGRRGW